MVYNTQLLGFRTLSNVRNRKNLVNTSFRNPDRSPFTGDWRKALILLGPLIQWLRLALSRRTNRVSVFLSSRDDGNRSNFGNAMFTSFWNSGRWTKSRIPVILKKIRGMFYCFAGRFPRWYTCVMRLWTERLRKHMRNGIKRGSFSPNAEM
jgi:hypothetical protein